MLPTARRLLPWLLAGGFAAAQLPLALAPVGGLHRHRQADTAAVARNLAFESFDLLHPRVDVRGDLSGITGMELPAYQAMVALAMRAAGSGADAIGKLVALGWTLVAWALVARVLRRRFGLSSLAVHGALAASPVLFTYGGRFMPESFALACGAAALERFEAWWTRGGAGRLAASAAAIGLAALVRPFVVFLGFPLLAGFLVLAARRDRRAWAVGIAGAAALVPFTLWYAAWCPHLVRTYGLAYFFTGSPVRENVAKLATADFWRALGLVVAQQYVSWPLLPVAAYGALRLWRDDRPGTRALAFGLPAVALTGVVLTSGRHFLPHSYYLMALVPPVALWVAAGFDGLGARWPRALPWVVVAAALALPAALWHHYRPDGKLAPYAGVLPAVAARVSEADLVLVEDTGSYAWHLHPLRRRGWVAPRARLHDAAHVAELSARGCRWVVWLDGDTYRLAPIDAWLARLRGG